MPKSLPSRMEDLMHHPLSIPPRSGDTRHTAGPALVRGGATGYRASPDRSSSAFGSGSRPMKLRYNSAGSSLSPRERIRSRKRPAHFAAEDAAALESREGVGVQHLSPLVGIIAGAVTHRAGEQVRKADDHRVVLRQLAGENCCRNVRAQTQQVDVGIGGISRCSARSTSRIQAGASGRWPRGNCARCASSPASSAGMGAPVW
jgi:hypothetical protein